MATEEDLKAARAELAAANNWELEARGWMLEMIERAERIATRDFIAIATARAERDDARAELRAVAAERDAAIQRAAELEAALAATRDDLDDARHDIARLES